MANNNEKARIENNNYGKSLRNLFGNNNQYANNNYKKYVGINENAAREIEAQEAAKLEKKNIGKNLRNLFGNNGNANNKGSLPTFQSSVNGNNGALSRPNGPVFNNFSNNGRSNNGLANLNDEFPNNKSGNLAEEPEPNATAPWVRTGNNTNGGRRSRKSQCKNRKSRKNKKSRKQRKNRKSRKN
jgi:hypothetical protein